MTNDEAFKCAYDAQCKARHIREHDAEKMRAYRAKKKQTLKTAKNVDAEIQQLKVFYGLQVEETDRQKLINKHLQEQVEARKNNPKRASRWQA